MMIKKIKTRFFTYLMFLPLLLTWKAYGQSKQDSTYLALYSSISDTLFSRYNGNILENPERMLDTFFIHGVIKISIIKDKAQGTKVIDISATDKQINQYMGSFDFLRRYDYSQLMGERKDATIVIPIFMHHNFSKALWRSDQVNILRSLFGLGMFPHHEAQITRYIFFSPIIRKTGILF